MEISVEHGVLEFSHYEYQAVYVAQLKDDSELEYRRSVDEAEAEALVRYVDRQAERTGIRSRGRVEKRAVYVGEWSADESEVAS